VIGVFLGFHLIKILQVSDLSMPTNFFMTPSSVLESRLKLACISQRLGYDFPVIHSVQPNRHGLVYTLMEPVRPSVDRLHYQLMAKTKFDLGGAVAGCGSSVEAARLPETKKLSDSGTKKARSQVLIHRKIRRIPYGPKKMSTSQKALFCKPKRGRLRITAEEKLDMDETGKRMLEKIFSAGLRAVDPEEAVRRNVMLEANMLRVGDRSYSLSGFERIVVTGFGKGTAPMAKALEDVLGDRLSDGWITVKYGHGLQLRRIRVMEAGHPIPDQAGLRATRFVLDRLEECTERDLVLCAFSGGGSALSPAPRSPVTLSDKQETTRLLLESGATINELNSLRKHLSLCKGGQLAKIAFPASIISLFLSDVVGDPLDVIASGPTVPDPTTFAECIGIIERYRLSDKLPHAVLKLLRDGAMGMIEETPKPGDAVFEKVRNLVVGNNRAALSASAKRARELGYSPLILSSFIQGEAREIAEVFTAIGKEIIVSGRPIPPPACILAGGEPTVAIRGNGKGGRNQELALAAALTIDGWDRIALLSAGTDGTDGPTDAAGAFVDGSTCRSGREMGLNPQEYLDRNDSYNYFKPLGDLLVTGPTRTNVMDVICMLVDKR
jgi:hydroxypyruvate reductase